MSLSWEEARNAAGLSDKANRKKAAIGQPSIIGGSVSPHSDHSPHNSIKKVMMKSTMNSDGMEF